MLIRLEELPVRYANRFRRWGITPFLLLTVAAVLLLPSLEINTSRHDRPGREDPYFDELLEIQSHFERSSSIVLALEPREGDVLLSDRMLEKINNLSARLQQIDGIAGVISPAAISDISTDGDTLDFRPVPLSQADTVIRETPLFKKMLLSENENAVTMLVIPESGHGDVEVSQEVISLVGAGDFGEVHVLGYPVVSYYVDIGTQSDFFILTTLAAGVMLLAFILIAKELRTGFLLWVASVLPALWTAALFPLFDIQMRISGIMVPVLTLGLATTYSIHLFRHARTDYHEGRDGVLRGAAPIISAAALTTMLGFATLLISPELELKHLGLFIICGIAFSVASSLFFLPALLFPGKSGVITVPVGKQFVIRAGRGRSNIPAVAIIAAAVALGAGAYRIHSDYRIENTFRANHPLAENARYFNATYGGIEEVELIIDTNKEYGLVSPEVYNSIRRIAADLESLEPVNHVLSIVDFVDWANGRFAGSRNPVAPESDVEIGEALELLAGGEAGLSLESLVNPDYSETRILIKYGYAGEQPKYYMSTQRKITGEVKRSMTEYLPEADFWIGGQPIVEERVLGTLTQSVGISVAIFFPVIFFLLYFVLKSFKKAILPLLPAAAGVIVYFGAMGWCNFPFNVVTNVAIATAMGVSVDDAIYYLLYYERRRRKHGAIPALLAARENTGTAIVQTTAIINACLLVLLFSTYRSVTQAGVMIIMGFIVATLVTLVVIPRIIRRIDRIPGEQKGE